MDNKYCNYYQEIEIFPISGTQSPYRQSQWGMGEWTTWTLLWICDLLKRNFDRGKDLKICDIPGVFI